MNTKLKRLFLIDMDGTIYIGEKMFETTPSFLSAINKIGANYVFFTNNSSKGRSEYLEKLNRMGIKTSAEKIISSTDAAAFYLLENHKNSLIYAFGTIAFCEELSAYGLNITQNPDSAISVIVMGFDTELSYKKLWDICALLCKNPKLAYVATNPDITCPTEFGYIPDCGSFAQIIKNATGREPIFLGKPAPYMVDIALSRFSTSPKDAIIVGDRLYTDIACGIACNVDTALVLSGETKREDISCGLYSPTYIYKDVGEIAREITKTYQAAKEPMPPHFQQ